MASLDLSGKTHPAGDGQRISQWNQVVDVPAISIRTFFSRFKIVLEEQADAVRAFLAIADCVEPITIAQDDLKVFISRSERYATARARLPVAALGKTG